MSKTIPEELENKSTHGAPGSTADTPFSFFDSGETAKLHDANPKSEKFII